MITRKSQFLNSLNYYFNGLIKINLKVRFWRSSILGCENMYNTTVTTGSTNSYIPTRNMRQKLELFGIGKYLVTTVLLRTYNNAFLVP